MPSTSKPGLTRTTTTILWVVFFCPLVRAAGDNSRELAQNLEKQGRWFEASCLYDELLSKDRNHPEYRDAYRRCLRHFRQQRRLDDHALQSLVGKMTTAEAGNLYDQVLGIVAKYYAGRERAEASNLFQQGLQELRASTQKKAFLDRHLIRVSEADLAEFRATLDTFEGERIPGLDIAGERIRKIIIAGKQLGLPPGVIALELACGAANSLDEYSLYLAPGRVTPAQAAQKNKIVGVGMEITMTAGRLEVSRVYRKSPASDVGLVKGDRITRIDGNWVDPLAPDLAAERLLGESGTSVELEFIPRGQSMAQTVKVTRQSVLPVSVDWDRRGDTGDYIGYIHIHAFQESTAQEVKETRSTHLQAMPLRGIILDLRGNPGGLLKSALDTAQLFLPELVILHTESPLKSLTRTYKSLNTSPYAMPLAVLVDGDTASSAEVVAGALKDNQRAILIGQPTYGKASIQYVFPLENAPGGLRLTVAKFSTPSRVALSGRGLMPDVPVSESDPEVAMKTAEQVLRGSMMMLR